MESFYLQKKCDKFNEYLLKNNLISLYDEINGNYWKRQYLFFIFRKIWNSDLDENDEIKNMKSKSNGEKFISIKMLGDDGKKRKAKIVKKLKTEPHCYEVRLNADQERLRIIFFTGPTSVLKCPSSVFSFIIDKYNSKIDNVERKVDELIYEAGCCRNILSDANVSDLIEKIEGDPL